MKRLLRPIGYSELLTEYINHVTPHNIVAIGKINSTIPPDIIKDATALIIQKYSLLRSFIAYDKYFSFYEGESKNPYDYFHFTYYDAGIKTLNSIIEEDIQCQLSKENKILTRVTQISTECDTTILLTLQHTICDGVSIMNLLIELFSTIDKLISNRKYDLKITFAKPSLDDILFKMPIKIKNNLYTRRENETRLSYTLAKNRYTGIKKVVVNLNSRNKIIEVAKKKSITVTSLILSFLIIALKANINNSPGYIGTNIMVDLRKHISQISKNDLGFYCGYIHIDFKSCINTFDELTMEIGTQVKTFLKKNAAVHFSREYKSFLETASSINELMKKIKITTPSVGISNIGIVATSHLNNFMIEEISFAVSCHAYSQTKDAFFVCMNTYGNNIYVNFHHPMPIFSRARMDTIVNDFFRIIDSL